MEHNLLNIRLRNRTNVTAATRKLILDTQGQIQCSGTYRIEYFH